MVDGTGLAPARACAHEFLRLACIHSTTRRKGGAAGASCTLTRPRAQRFLRPPGLLVAARPQILVAAAGVAPARARGPTDFEAAVFADFTTPRRNWYRRQVLHPHWQRSRRCASSFGLHRHGKWSIHRDVRPAVCLTMAVRRSLRVGCTIAWEGDRRWGLEQELHLRPSPYEGAALTAAPSSQGRAIRGGVRSEEIALLH